MLRLLGLLVLLVAVQGCRSTSPGDSLILMMFSAADAELLAIRKVVVVGAPPPSPGGIAEVASWVTARSRHEEASLTAAQAFAVNLRRSGFAEIVHLEESRERARPVEVAAVLSWSEADAAVGVARTTSATAVVWVAAGRDDAPDGRTVELRQGLWITPLRDGGLSDSRHVSSRSQSITFPDGRELGRLSADDRERLRDAFRELFDELRGLEWAEPAARPLEEALDAVLREGALRPEDRERIVAGLVVWLSLARARR